MSDEEAEIEMEMDIAEMEPDAITSAIRPGTASGYGCPECGGALFSLTNGDLTHFRCRVGHAWSTDALLNRQGETLDAALWTALRALEENMALSLSVAARMRRRGPKAGARRFEDQAQIARRNADTIRHVLSQERGSGGSQRPASVLHADIGAPAGAIDPAPDTGP
jgi:two-component system chemotaxis response regulator CheB